MWEAGVLLHVCTTGDYPEIDAQIDLSDQILNLAELFTYPVSVLTPG